MHDIFTELTYLGCILHTITLVLTNLGEKLSDSEVDELLKGVEVDKSGKVHYEGNDLISIIFIREEGDD